MSTNKPMPARTDISAPFWDGLESGRVTLPRCRSCGHWIFDPRRHGDACWSHDLEWQDVSGAGSLYTYTLTRIPTLPDFADEMPQALAVVELDQGVRINTTLVGLAEDEIRVGMRLKPVFQRVNTDGTTLLATTLARLDRAPKRLLSGSAIGFYGDTGERPTDESGPAGTGYLPDLCTAWENAAQPAIDAGISTAFLRTGVVLSPDGGALAPVGGRSPERGGGGDEHDAGGEEGQRGVEKPHAPQVTRPGEPVQAPLATVDEQPPRGWPRRRRAR